MPMFYALVARGQVPLAEMQMKGNDGNFPTVTRVLLGKIATTPDSKMSYQYDECVLFRFSIVFRGGMRLEACVRARARRRLAFRPQLELRPPAPQSPLSAPSLACSYVFHYMVDDGITYLCLSDDKNKRRVPFLYLADVRDKFCAMYGDRKRTAIAFSMNGEFARILEERIVSRKLVPVTGGALKLLVMGVWGEGRRRISFACRFALIVSWKGRSGGHGFSTEEHSIPPLRPPRRPPAELFQHQHRG